MLEIFAGLKHCNLLTFHDIQDFIFQKVKKQNKTKNLLTLYGCFVTKNVSPMCSSFLPGAFRSKQNCCQVLVLTRCNLILRYLIMLSFQLTILAK